MNENYNGITAKYREADFNNRLNMYLQYPQLRSDFIRIDRKDLETDLSAGLKSCPKMPLAQISMVQVLVTTFKKKIFGIASA